MIERFYRAFEINKIRISYYIDEAAKAVKIIRVRSTHQKPFSY